MKPIFHSFLQQLRDAILVLIITLIITLVYRGKGFFENMIEYANGIGFGVLVGFSLWKVNQFIGWFIGRKLSWVNYPKQTLLASLATSTVASIIDIYLVYYFGFRWFFGINLVDKIQIYIPQMFLILTISLVITISYYLAYFFKWWRISVVNEERLKQEAIQLRYNALKSQINPHFLFNSLSALSSLIDTNPEMAKQFIQQFSNIYRYVLDQKDKELVPLADELKFIAAYIELQMIRYGNNLKVYIDVEDQTGFIVPLSLQTLLENCFKHNIISAEMPLSIRIWREEGYVVVQNNFQPKKTIGDNNGIGLETISKSCEYLLHRRVEVMNDNSNFTVKVPVTHSISV